MTPIRVEIELADGSFTTGMLRAGQSIRDLQRAVSRANPELANFGNGFAGLSNADANLRAFQIGMARLNPALRGIRDSSLNAVVGMRAADREAKSLLATFRDLSIVGGVVGIGLSKVVNIFRSGWIGDVIKINSEMERLQFQMQSMSRAADPVRDAAASVQYLRQQSLQTPLSLQALTNGFVKMKATGIDPMAGAMSSLADGVAAFGGSDEAFNRSILAISQMSGKGVIQMEELRQQLGEAMPRAVELMARSMGISMAELIQQISTGTVQAKPALELLFRELDRTYGGRAQFMMQTFEGQLKRTQTQLQILADDAGQPFFEEMKRQITDLNDALGSDALKSFAADLGSLMGEGIRQFRGIVDWAVEYRSELGNIAKVALMAFGGLVVMRGITALREGMRMLALDTGRASLAFGQARMSWYAFNVALNSSVGPLSIARAGMTGLIRSAGFLVTGLAAIAPWVAAVGLGVYAAGEYFGWFSNKVKQSYDELVKFGAETRDQAADAIDARIDQIKQKIEELDRVWLRSEKHDQFARGLNNELEAILAERERLISTAGKREDRAMMATFQDTMNERMAALQGVYDAESVAIQNEMDQKLRVEAEAGRSTETLNKERSDRLLKARLDFYDKQKALVVQALAEEQRLAIAGTDVIGTQVEQRMNYLNGVLRDLNERIYTEGQISPGAPTIDKPINEEERYNKGVTALKRIQAEVSGLEAGLKGASVEVKELQELLKDGRYGDGDVKRVRELVDALVDAQAEKERLDELFQAREQLEGDLERVRINQIQERMALEAQAAGTTLTDLDKFEATLNNSGYAGFDGPLLDGFGKVNQSIMVADQSAADAGVTMRDDAFGAGTINRIAVTTSMVNRLGAAMRSLGAIEMQMPAVPTVGGATPQAGPTIAAAQDLDALIEYNGQMRTLKSVMAELRADETKNRALQKDVALLEYNETLLAQQEAEVANADNLSKNYATLIKNIRLGKLGESTDINDARYASAIANAKELDRIAASNNSSTKSGNELLTARDNILQRQTEFAQRMTEAFDRMYDPLEQSSTSAYRSLRRELDAYAADAARAYGVETEAYRSAMAMKAQILQEFRNVEIAEQAASWAAENDELQLSFLNATQQRAENLRREIETIDRAVAEFRGSEDEKVEIVRIAEERKALLRQQANEATTPFIEQMREWGDITTALGDAATGWMDSIADGFADLIVEGKSAQDVMKSIASDMAKITIRWAFSSMMGGGSKGGTPKTLAQGHTGGIAGGRMQSRTFDPYSALPRYHTGGVIGDIGKMFKPVLRSDEVPIVAKKGEGVFTPAQMKALGGGASRAPTYHIAMPVSISSSAGTPEQNEDMATRIANSLDRRFRSIVAEENQKAARNGNTGNSRSF